MADGPQTSPDVATLKRRYNLFLSERRFLARAANESAVQYAKAIMTLAAGALVLSVTLLKDLAPDPSPQAVAQLKAAWVFFAGSLGMIVASFLLAQFAQLRQITVAQIWFVPELPVVGDSSTDNTFVGWTRALSISSAVALALGIAFLVLFSGSVIRERGSSRDAPGRDANTTVVVADLGSSDLLATCPLGMPIGENGGVE